MRPGLHTIPGGVQQDIDLLPFLTIRSLKKLYNISVSNCCVHGTLTVSLTRELLLSNAFACSCLGVPTMLLVVVWECQQGYFSFIQVFSFALIFCILVIY